MYYRKGQKYFIVAVNGTTSKAPFPHPTLKAATVEAKRLALVRKGAIVYVYAAYFKVVADKDGNLIQSQLQYKKPSSKKEVKDVAN